MDNNSNSKTATRAKLKDEAAPGEFTEKQVVQLRIGAITDLGYKAVVNETHWGILYGNEVFEGLDIGQEMKGYIKKIRPDGRLDLSLYPEGNYGATDLGNEVLAKLTEAGGFLPLNDKAEPDLIYKIFGVSKKKYKIAIGGLYKDRKIVITEKGIELAKK